MSLYASLSSWQLLQHLGFTQCTHVGRKDNAKSVQTGKLDCCLPEGNTCAAYPRLLSTANNHLCWPLDHLHRTSLAHQNRCPCTWLEREAQLTCGYLASSIEVEHVEATVGIYLHTELPPQHTMLQPRSAACVSPAESTVSTDTCPETQLEENLSVAAKSRCETGVGYEGHATIRAALCTVWS